MGWSLPSFILLSFSVGLISSNSIAIKYGTEYVKPLKCNQGQAYWCHNITTAVECSALKHCIQGVWEKEIPIEKDKSEVCQICLDMVKTARDQLESNETQEDIKTVLEGSCMLIPIKIVRKECIKLMDDFAPQLIDVLSSQMNPQVVCSVAGLCNNNRILQLEQEYHMNADISPQSNALNCDNCNELMVLMGQKLTASSPDSVFNFFVELCGKTGSYSDACASLVAMHKGEIYEFLQKIIHGGPVCSFVGVCKEKYHNHNKDLVRVSIHTSSIDTKIMNTNDDLPCDLCISLVSHLKDILMSNTTEMEFQIVLKAICLQMTLYKNECLKIVDEYYVVVYNFLKEELDGKTLCKQIGICPAVTKINQAFLRPLIFDNSETNKDWIDDLSGNEELQLPAVLYNPFTLVPASFLNVKNMPNDKMVCSMCEYFLHFLQQEITLPSTEKEIENYAMKVCDKLPKTVTAQCNSFVQTYMNDFVAILANEIDPSQVCPKIGACPGDLVLVEYNDKPTCPLCLLAMEEIIRKIPNKTEVGVADAIANLCLRDVFPNSLSIDCVKFITENRQAIIEMVLAEFTAQESCVYLDVCVVPNKQDTIKPIGNIGSIQSNEITDEVQEKSMKDSTTCVMCEFIMAKVDQFLKQNKTEEEIKHFFLTVCKHLPKTVTAQCSDFVNQYADLVLTLLAAELDPKQICTALNLCGNATFVIETQMKECLFCDMLMSSLRRELTCKDSLCSDDINTNLQKACLHFPVSEQSFCTSMIHKIGPQVESALDTLPVGPLVCERIHMCNNVRAKENTFLGLSGERTSCYRGPSYWCQSTKTAAACNKIEYCQKYIWKANKPRRSHNKGRIVIRY